MASWLNNNQLKLPVELSCFLTSDEFTEQLVISLPNTDQFKLPVWALTSLSDQLMQH